MKIRPDGTYRFPPMLEGAEEFPSGSADWALRLANELNYTVRNAGNFGVKPVIPLVEKVINHEPWRVWPEDEPARSIDRFFILACGLDYKQVFTLIKGYIRDESLARRLAAAKGRDESAITQGSRTDLEPRSQRTKLDRGETAAYLLRRLARDHANILARYERGEFKSVRDAAKDAGIIKKRKCPHCGKEL